MTEDKKWIRRLRLLTELLIVSGAVNIFFLVFFLYSTISRKHIKIEVSPRKEIEKKKEFSNSEYFSKISSLGFRELISLLSNDELIEEGYRKRDIALGCLITFHEFNVEKALINQGLQKRKVFYPLAKSEKKEVLLIAGLSDHHYESIIHFAFSEKWPLTSKGLFLLLKKWEKPRDVSLEKAFLVTDEFYIISNLFSQSDLEIRQPSILDLICECSWEFVENFIQQQKKAFDYSKERRLQFLLDALAEKSKTAAELLLKTDFIYALKRLSDSKILQLLSLLNDQTKELEQFCVELIKSSRSDLVWQNAAAKLYKFFGQAIPKELVQKDVLKKFVFTDDLKSKWQKQEINPASLSTLLWGKDKLANNIHIVKEGENLWKIARLYKVDIDELVRVNHLESNRIYPGLEIVIPKN